VVGTEVCKKGGTVQCCLYNEWVRSIMPEKERLSNTEPTEQREKRDVAAAAVRGFEAQRRDGA